MTETLTKPTKTRAPNKAELVTALTDSTTRIDQLETLLDNANSRISSLSRELQHSQQKVAHEASIWKERDCRLAGIRLVIRAALQVGHGVDMELAMDPCGVENTNVESPGKEIRLLRHIHELTENEATFLGIEPWQPTKPSIATSPTMRRSRGSRNATPSSAPKRKSWQNSLTRNAHPVEKHRSQ